MEKRPTILIVDDERLQRDGLQHALADRYDVLVADEAQKAGAILEAQPVDVLLTDLRMPGDDGLKLLNDGNARFVEMKLQHPNVSIERRSETAKYGQKPFAIVLACSDSRVPVEVVFDRGGFKYIGTIKNFADTARARGLEF